MGCCIGRKKVLPGSGNQSTPGYYASNRKVGSQRGQGRETTKRREVRVNMLVEQQYNIFSSIGKGEFGHVVRAEHKHSKIPYAIKIIDLSDKDLNEKAQSRSELEILRTVNHKYVVRLHDVIVTTRRLYLVMDLATGGELMDRICLFGKFDENDAVRVLTMIFDGLLYLHSNGITHRDLKPQNILYYHPGNDSKIIITDFGLATMWKNRPASYRMKTDCGTIEYMAPEVITRVSYTNAVDMWSMGVIAYVVLSGRLPFPINDNGNVLSTLRMICFCKYSFEGEPWNDISDEAKDFIRSLIVYEPSKRLTASEALEHKWLKGKQHKKLDLRRSISSNWSDSCVSLKNEKGLRRHTRTNKQDSTDLKSTKNSGIGAKGKRVCKAIYRSCDDKLVKGSHGTARVSEWVEGTQRGMSATKEAAQKNNSCAAKRSENATNCNEQGDASKSTSTDKLTSAPPQYPFVKVKTQPKVVGVDAESNARDTDSEDLRCKNTTSLQRNESKQRRGSKVSPVTVSPEASCERNRGTTSETAKDCNGNMAVPSSTRCEESRADGTISSRRNQTDHVTERTPLKANNRLPPIKSSFTPLSTLNDTVQ